MTSDSLPHASQCASTLIQSQLSASFSPLSFLSLNTILAIFQITAYSTELKSIIFKSLKFLCLLKLTSRNPHNHFS